MGEEKTEKATPKKRRDERKKGHVFLSQDAVSVATLFGAVAILRLVFFGAAEAVSEFTEFCLSRAAGGGTFSQDLLVRSILLTARITGPLLAVSALLGIGATFLQTGMLVAFERIKPKFENVNPLEGFKKLFSLRSLVETLKNLLKIIILLYLVYGCVRDMMGFSERYMYADIKAACAHLLGQIFAMLLRVSLAFLVLAALDFLYQRWDFERQMRMSKQEIKEEYKQTEGDPQVKGKIKELQRRMAQSRMMQQVPKADVIIRNPTHVAIALRYRYQEDPAPVVLAKGLGTLAARIVAVGEKHGVLVMENVPLAHALYAQAELNQAIPADLYEAVAEVMVYLYKLGRVKADMRETGGPAS